MLEGKAIRQLHLASPALSGYTLTEFPFEGTKPTNYITWQLIDSTPEDTYGGPVEFIEIQFDLWSRADSGADLRSMETALRSTFNKASTTVDGTTVRFGLPKRGRLRDPLGARRAIYTYTLYTSA